MIDLLYYAGAAILGGVAGFFIGKAIAKYVDKAVEWFNQVWHELSRVSRAVGILFRQGNKLVKRFLAIYKNGDYQEYGDPSDEGVEIEWGDLSEEAKKALQDDGFIVVKSYGE